MITTLSTQTPVAVTTACLACQGSSVGRPGVTLVGDEDEILACCVPCKGSGQVAADPMVPRTFTIHYASKGMVEAKVAKLVKKANKLGLPAPSVAFGEVYFVQVRKSRPVEAFDIDEGPAREEYYFEEVAMCVASVTGPVVRIPDWTFIAGLDHREGGNIVRNITGEELPEVYRTRKPACDHCKTSRMRADTYVLRSDRPEDLGTYVQVGRTCLADFIGSKTADDIVAMATYARDLQDLAGEIEEEDTRGGGGGGRQTVWSLESFLSMVLAIIRTSGYVSKKMVEEGKGGTPTGHATIEALCYRPGRDRSQEAPPAVTDADKAKMETVLAWVRATTDTSEFMHNLRVIANGKMVTHRDAGFVAAMPVAYERAMNTLKPRTVRPVSKHVGTEGKREVFQNLRCFKILAMEGQYGVTYLHMFEDPSGNVLKWFASGHSLEEGATYHVKGTVKKHDTYDNKEQTVLSRCKAEVVPDAASATTVAS